MRARTRAAIGVGAVLVLGTAVFVVPSWVPKSAEQRCHDALRDRRNQDAVTECTRAFEAEPKGEIAASLANAYFILNKLDEAWTWATRPEATDQLRATRVRANVLIRRGEVGRATRMLEEVLRVAQERDDRTVLHRGARPEVPGSALGRQATGLTCSVWISPTESRKATH